MGFSATNEALCYYEHNGRLWNKTIITCPIGWEMNTGDVDNDGEIEIAWGSYAATENEIRVFDFELNAWSEIMASDLQNSTPAVDVYHVCIADVDNDNQNELAFGLDDGKIGYSEYDSGI
ncbi:MAG: hypothetical protein ACFFCX_15125 [Candidatus Sifarchaeia archaeon]